LATREPHQEWRALCQYFSCCQ